MWAPATHGKRPRRAVFTAASVRSALSRLAVPGVRAGAMRELQATWALFSLDNVSITIVPGALFTASSAIATHRPAAELLEAVPQALVYFLLYGYTFCLSNQLAGIEEDRLNKPHRPLVRGLMTPSGAWRRLVLGIVAFALTGWWLDVWPWTFCWIGVTLLHNQGRLSRYWIAKNSAMSAGILAMLVPGAHIAGALDAATWQWILVLALANGYLVSVQDLRDIAGDAAVGRCTFPQAVGEQRARWLIAGGFVLFPVVTHFLLFEPTRPWSIAAPIVDTATVLSSWLIAYRVAWLRSRIDDHRTYLIYCWQYCMLLLAPAAISSF